MTRITAALLFAGTASAAVATWGQCGGINYNGDTECIDGAFCTSWNPYYFQCVPGTATATSSTSSVQLTTATDEPTTTTDNASSSTSSSTSSSGPTQTTDPDVTYLFTFGDSYSQTGFDYTGNKPNAQNPLGNPALPGWTASGGLNWVGFMVTEFNDTTRLSYNFAYGGATVDADLVEPYTSTVKSMIDQVADFSASLGTHPEYAPWTAENTLVGVWMGVNDIGNSYWLEDKALLQSIVAKYFEQLQIIYDAGARQFVLLTVPRKFTQTL